MLLYILIITILVIIEQIVKYIVVNNINLYQQIILINNFFNLTYVKNTGAAWSIFEGKMTLFYVVTFIALSIFFYLLLKYGDFKKHKIFTISLLLIISGALGNFIDRLFLKYVVDYLEFNIFGYAFPVFNFADIFLTLGTIGFAYTILIKDTLQK